MDDHAYTIEPQVSLGPEDGVSVCCKPDFLIRPARSTQPCLPVAVFTDGFEYHKQGITEDTLKRLALSQSGRFWTWSLTWQDLENALSGTDGTLRPLPPPGTGSFDAGSVKIATALGCDGLLPTLVQSPFDQLLAWLRRPEGPAWAGAVFARALSWAKPDVDTPAVAATRDWLRQRAPSPVRERLDEIGPALCGEVRLGEEGSAPDCKWIVPASALKAPLMPSALIALLTLDVAASKDEKALREAWRRLLAGANLLQFLPCAIALTAEGSATGVYEQAGWARLHPASGPTLGTGSPLWQAAMDDAVSEAGPGLAHLMRRGAPLPAVGFELQAETGAILAEAELAWEKARVAVLRPDQEDQTPAWQEAGWTVFRLDEDWAEQALAQLRG